MNLRIQLAVAVALVCKAGAVVMPPLSTQESRIIDSKGKQIRFACVNWYGAHMKRHVVNGLDKRSISEIAGHIASLGFNCVRLPFSNEMYWDNPRVAADTVSANPQFAGRPAMEVYDAVVAELTRKGIMVILNDHNSDAQWCCSEEDGNGLWYTTKYPVEKWQKMWVELVRRYRTNPLVVGADLRNELRKANGKWPSWGMGGAKTDWKRAAEKCGNAILSENSNLLIIIEGLEYAANIPARSGAAKLCVPNKLVYSGHVYSWYGISCDSYSSFSRDVKRKQSYVTDHGESYTAPYWLGEFGTDHSDACWKHTIQWLKDNTDIHWAYWAIDGYKNHPGDGESFGILHEDYRSTRHDWKLRDLQSVQSGAELAESDPSFASGDNAGGDITACVSASDNGDDDDEPDSVTILISAAWSLDVLKPWIAFVTILATTLASVRW